VLCVPSKAVEAWLVAATFEDKHPLQNGIECNPSVEAQLRALPVARRIQKSSREYRARERTITEGWSVVRQRCTQAERFSSEVVAVGL